MADIYQELAETWRVVGFSQCRLRVSRLLYEVGEYKLAERVRDLEATNEPDVAALEDRAAAKERSTS